VVAFVPFRQTRRAVAALGDAEESESFHQPPMLDASTWDMCHKTVTALTDQAPEDET
jgi:hypothetical protein